ncbi:MAG: hypothetical protein H6701_16635, partial [Myxococcales bacterium]|nr:hypothetical protein [Myxococcales bacterium]
FHRRNLLGQLLAARGDLDGAAVAFDAVLRIAERYADRATRATVAVTHARAFEAVGAYDRAIPILEQARAAWSAGDDGDREAHQKVLRALANALTVVDRDAESGSIWRQLIAWIEQTPGADPPFAERYSLAQSLAFSGELDEAEAIVRVLLVSGDDVPGPVLGMATSLHEQLLSMRGAPLEVGEAADARWLAAARELAAAAPDLFLQQLHQRVAMVWQQQGPARVVSLLDAVIDVVDDEDAFDEDASLAVRRLFADAVGGALEPEQIERFAARLQADATRFGPEHVLLAPLLHRYTLLLSYGQQVEAAVGVGRQAVALREAVGDRPHLHPLGATRLQLAIALERAGQFKHAAVTAQRARDELSREPGAAELVEVATTLLERVGGPVDLDTDPAAIRLGSDSELAERLAALHHRLSEEGGAIDGIDAALSAWCDTVGADDADAEAFAAFLLTGALLKAGFQSEAEQARIGAFQMAQASGAAGLAGMLGEAIEPVDGPLPMHFALCAGRYAAALARAEVTLAASGQASESAVLASAVRVAALEGMGQARRAADLEAGLSAMPGGVEALREARAARTMAASTR